MTIKSFVAFLPSTENDNYRVAIGNCYPLEEIQFIELEYTDSGVLIHYYNCKCKEYNDITTQKYFDNKSDSQERYAEFESNQELKKVLINYADQTCENVHVQGCDCVACSLLPKNLYIFSFDVIKIMKKLFEQPK